MAEELKKYRIVIPHFTREGVFYDKDSIVEAYPSDASITWFDAETGEPVAKKSQASHVGALSEEEKAFILELRGAKPKTDAPPVAASAPAVVAKVAPSKGRAADKDAL